MSLTPPADDATVVDKGHGQPLTRSRGCRLGPRGGLGPCRCLGPLGSVGALSGGGCLSRRRRGGGGGRIPSIAAGPGYERKSHQDDRRYFQVAKHRSPLNRGRRATRWNQIVHPKLERAVSKDRKHSPVPHPGKASSGARINKPPERANAASTIREYPGPGKAPKQRAGFGDADASPRGAPMPTRRPLSPDERSEERSGRSPTLRFARPARLDPVCCGRPDRAVID
jgi:hypothetical protein